MKRRRIARLLACVTLAAAGTAEPKTYVSANQAVKSDFELGFFGGSRDQFLATYKRVAILPVEFPPEFGDRPDAQRALEEAVTKYLVLAKIEVIPSQRFSEFADRYNHELGGMYNPRNGELRADVRKQVIANARRDLLAAEHPDGFVRLAIVRKMAAMSGSDLHWDDVREHSFGGPRKKGDDWKPVGEQADLAAISLRLEVFKTPEQIAYGYNGGIQPLTYARDIADLGVTAVMPKAEDILKDPERIDRAARAVTMGLRHSPKEIATFRNKPEFDVSRIDPDSLPPLPEPQPNTPPSPLLRPREEILNSVHRVALAALDDGEFYTLQATADQISERIHAELAPLHWELVDAPQAKQMLIREIVATPLFDRYTGMPNEAGFSAARKQVFHSLGLTPAPDAILWLKLVRTMTMQREGDVVWDGANQNAVTLGPAKNLGKTQKLWKWGSASPGSASIRASTLKVLLTDANDTQLYLGRGGVELVEKVVVGTYGTRNDSISSTELFKNPERIDHAVHLALRELVLTPQALEAELNPKSR